MFSFSFNSKSPFVALDTLLKTQIIWTQEFLDFFFFMLVFKLLEITFSNFSLTWGELGTSLCFLAWKQKFSLDHLSVDTRDIRQRAIIGRLMMRLQTLAALCIHSEHCRGMLTGLPAYPSISHWKSCHLLKKNKNLSNGTFWNILHCNFRTSSLACELTSHVWWSLTDNWSVVWP